MGGNRQLAPVESGEFGSGLSRARARSGYRTAGRPRRHRSPKVLPADARVLRRHLVPLHFRAEQIDNDLFRTGFLERFPELR